MTRKEASRAAARKAAMVTNRIKALKARGWSHDDAKRIERQDREFLELLDNEARRREG